MCRHVEIEKMTHDKFLNWRSELYKPLRFMGLSV